MATYTPNLNLKKPSTGENYDVVSAYSSSMDKIDITFENEKISVKHFGAIGDGIADDTLAIQNAIAYAVAQGKKKVFFPAGNYLVKSTLTIPIGVTLLGHMDAQNYNGTGASTTISFDGCITGIDCARNPYIVIENIRLNGMGTTETVIKFGYFTKLKNVTVTGGSLYGGEITLGQCGYYENCSFSGNVNGLHLVDDQTTTQTFANCFIRENTAKGIVGDTSDCYFLRCIIESNVQEGIYLTWGRKLMKFESCYYEANNLPNGNHMYLKDTEASFDNCDFGSTEIVTVANIANSKIRFKDCKHVGNIASPAYTMDNLSTVENDNSFIGYPEDIRALRVKKTREIYGEIPWNLIDNLSELTVTFTTPLPDLPTHIFLTSFCTEPLIGQASTRTANGFVIKVTTKPTGANGSIFWKVNY